MIKTKPSYAGVRKENIKALIAEVKVRNHLLDSGVAKLMNLPLGTFRERKKDPNKFRLEDIWMLMQAAKVDEERKSEFL